MTKYIEDDLSVLIRVEIWLKKFEISNKESSSVELL